METNTPSSKKTPLKARQFVQQFKLDHRERALWIQGQFWPCKKRLVKIHLFLRLPWFMCQPSEAGGWDCQACAVQGGIHWLITFSPPKTWYVFFCPIGHKNIKPIIGRFNQSNLWFAPLYLTIFFFLGSITWPRKSRSSARGRPLYRSHVWAASSRLDVGCPQTGCGLWQIFKAQNPRGL